MLPQAERVDQPDAGVLHPTGPDAQRDALVVGSDPVLTVEVGSRNSLGSAVTYSAARSPNARTGFVDLRSEARYHRARVTIAGAFDSALGIEYQAVSSGAT